MNNKSVQYGIIAALVSIIISALSYILFSNEMISGKFGVSTILQFVSYIALIYFMAKAVTDKRSEQGGFIRFKEGLKESFTTGAVWSVLAFVIGLIFQKVVFKSTYDRIVDATMQKQISSMEEQGMSEETIDSSIQMIQKIQEMAIYFGLPTLLVIAFIVALIISAILQKKNPQNFA